MITFKKNTYWVIYFYIAIILTIFILLPFFVPKNAFSYHPLMLLFIGIQILILLSVQLYRSRAQITLTDNAINYKDIFKQQSLQFDEIEGFSRLKWYNSSYITSHYVIHPKIKLKKSIKFNLSYNNINELTEWVENNLKNLDQEQEDIAYAKSLNNPVFGLNPIERELTIKRSKFVAGLLNSLGFIFLVISIFIDNNYIALLGIIIPLVTIVAIIYFRGLIKLEYIKKTSFFKTSKNKQGKESTSINTSVYGDVFLAITLPSIALIFITIRDFNVLNYSNVWLLALGISSLLLLTIIFISKEYKLAKISTYGKLIFLFLFLFGYGFGSTIILNSIIDDSTPTLYHQKILNKSIRIESKKSFIESKSYKLTVAPWLAEQKNKPQTIKVSKSLYENVTTKELITIQQKKGAFEIPWYKVSK